MASTDGLEADILSIAAASLHGQPVYHSVTSPDFSYSTCYGPLTFLIDCVGLVVGGGRFWVLRAMILVANLMICLGLYKIFRKPLRRDAALALMALPLGELMEHIRYAFGLRADVWIVLTVVLAVQATLMESQIWGAILAGFCAGLAIDFKVTLAVATLLLLLMVYQRSGIKLAAVAAGVAAVTALAPFALSGVSLIYYLQWLRVVGHQGVDPTMLGWCAAYAVLLILPLVILRLLGIDPFPRKPDGWSIYGMALVLCCVVGVTSVAAKPGGGVWHFWQLVPIIAAYVSLAIGKSQISNRIRLDYAVLIIAFGGMSVALSFLLRDIHVVRTPMAAEAEQLRMGRQEIDGYLEMYRGRTVQVGYGKLHPPVELLRYVPILRGQPYSLDGSRRLDVFGERFPFRVLEKMDHCTNDVWLIPHDDQPFIMPYVFPPVLHDTFVRDYAIEQRGTVLDAWVCKDR
jgi:hypothetical protein